jgi:hypothetical protein
MIWVDSGHVMLGHLLNYWLTFNDLRRRLQADWLPGALRPNFPTLGYF